MHVRTKKLTTIAMLSAVAFVVMAVGRIPVVLFLKYDPKDVIIVIGGFLFGPLASFVIAALVAFLELFTFSDTGVIGFIMNILSSCSFACPAAWIYKKKHNLHGAAIGLLAGCLSMAVVMISWNYIIAPIYMGYPREAVAELLLPAFLPFNLLKGGLNAAITFLLYKPVVTALRKTRLIDEAHARAEKKNKPAIVLVSALLFTTCIFFMLVLKGLV